MILDLFSHKPVSSNHVMVTKMMRLNPSPIVVDNKITKTSEFEEYDFVAYCSQFTSDDFSIGNLTSIGATDLLNMSVTMSMLTSANVANNLENLVYHESK